ncbi:HAMP domain-containing sensor histidine kinase [Paenibacillus dokdonensis]|uniref:Heme sensor protein HssS n=1 Tax=Paenibacillus dokdonensis TaxID=2567944 RepID=A0ABU6GSD7_9BACL|nr:HAMP domain-containing sensor histidine kinase [Paenibacillus dokdonensis]MEC0241072.1 HAMP domain-containing sensor histidine kinase [Paenibacillus dokdonensis]
MKSLYMRIVLTTIAVMMLSSVLAFVAANIFYQYELKPVNDSKVTHVAENIKHFYETNPVEEREPYLQNIGTLGYQIYVVDPQGSGIFYGGEFRNQELSPSIIRQVQQGQVYHGIKHFPSKAFITGFFDNTLINTIGIPLQNGTETYALFVRPNVDMLFGELHIFLAVIVVLIILLSILLVVTSTRYIVKPITKLTEATRLISQGTYHLKLNVNRKDEIGRLASHFSQMAKGLEQLEAMRQEFVSNVSHEIQSPLSSIQGFSQTLQSGGVSEEQRKHYLAVIESEARRMSQMSRQLLMLASLDKEEEVLEKTRFNVADQIKEVLLTTEWSWREKELALNMQLPEVSICADQKLLHQVWVNLMTNSVKFTPEGGTISIRLHQDEQNCYVDFKDSGIGISEENLPHIFNRFYKADKARSRHEGETGSGLGLAITHKIISMHGGIITVESREGAGTEFHIRLPLR